ncbi:MAG: radical SAM protein [Candidatus Auribacterota bacterium]
MKKICLQSNIIYGPIASRRLGNSLGINLLPTEFKLCSLDCTYCQYGYTQHKVFDRIPSDYVPAMKLVVKEVEHALKQYIASETTLDYLTFAGNGEPTLHPNFPELVSAIVELRDKYLPDVKTAILSNASRVSDASIRAALMRLDKRFMKLDAGDGKTFKEINNPHEKVSYSSVVKALSSMRPLILQTMLVDGCVCNSDDDHIDLLIDQYKKIQPIAIQIYSLDREPANASLVKVPQERLLAISRRIERETAIPVDIF